MKHLVASLCMLGVVTLAGSASAYQSFKGPMGVLQNEPGAVDGYTLITPQNSKTTYMIDMVGNVVNEWKSEYEGFYSELMPNGNLIRHSRLPKVTPGTFGGTSGMVEEFDWSGKKVWEYKMFVPGKEVSHHTFEVMPNGNVLLLGWEYKSAAEAAAAGRDLKNPNNRVSDKGVTAYGETVTGIWPDFIREVDHSGKTVWEWHVWDHLGKGPDKIDPNVYLAPVYSETYAGPDWTHFNGVAYDPKTDRICVTSRNLAEVYVIDRKSGKIVYRWGNPANYGQGRLGGLAYGDDGDQQLFGPHAPDWLPNGNISIMDNGSARPSDNYTRAVELDPNTGKVVWEWKPGNVGANPANFYSKYQDGAQKLANGNWIITCSSDGHVIEVTPEKNIVWEFVNPMTKEVVFATSSSNGNPGANVHKALRYPKDWPGFQGKDISVKKPLMPEGTPNWLELLKTNPNINKPIKK